MAKISELINSMIETALKASVIISPRFSDYRVADVLNLENPDIETEIKNMLNDINKDTKSLVSTKENKKIVELDKKIKSWDNNNVGEVARFTSNQMGNVKQIATDPTGFIIQTFIKKFARGVGIIALATVIFEAVKFVISELLKPGRWLDLRWKRDINKEIIAFRRREDQQRIKQGFSNIIITTGSRLRGGYGQVTNTLNMASGREKFPDNIGQSAIVYEAAGLPLAKAKGHRSFRGPGT